ncbi:FtsW/RodA/SpoVE family cell cycle protein [Gemmiger formicilis]|uniref:FtsW/RodA/SpoVE family cell cycle protein n=1 Tax=Gemmiger formicilis TaxID=745368 RepID=UPI00352300FA
MLWQTRQSIYAISTGGMFGVGIGASVQKHQWLPYAENDFIFGVIGEELGFFGCVILIGAFAVLLIMGVMIALRAPDLYGTVLGIGIISQIAWQVFLHIAVGTALIPNTGISLPFFSSGGTSLLLLLSEMGVLLSISRAGNAREQRLAEQHRAETERMLQAHPLPQQSRAVGGTPDVRGTAGTAYIYILMEVHHARFNCCRRYSRSHQPSAGDCRCPEGRGPDGGDPLCGPPRGDGVRPCHQGRLPLPSH